MGNYFKKYFLHIILFLVTTNACIAQQQYTFTNYTQEQGLPSGTIRGIYIDTTGYIWYTSEGCIARFDGYSYKTYRHNPDIPTNLPGNVVLEGVFPKFGDIYFGTKQNNFSFNPTKFSKVAAWLLVPYIAWVSFANLLNFSIWNLNR